MLNIFNNKEQIVEYLMAKDEKQNELFAMARKIRYEKNKNKVYVRGVMDISNYCRCNCKFCGNAAYVKNENRYRMSYEEIIRQVDVAKSCGLDVVHMASGEDKGYDFDVILKASQYIIEQGMYPELAVGKLGWSQYQKLYELGVRRLILKFETSDKDLFHDIKNCNANLDDLLQIIDELIERGFHVGTGNMIGIPGQSIESIADDLILLSKLKLYMASTSVFTPNKESMFANESRGDRNLAMNFIALLRCLKADSDISIPSNSTFGKEGKIKALQIASNELSFNITSDTYQNLYSIYEGKDRIKCNIQTIDTVIEQAGCEKSLLKHVIYE